MRTFENRRTYEAPQPVISREEMVRQYLEQKANSREAESLEPSLPIGAVNDHVIDSCNMKCRYCFATYVDTDGEGHYLPKEKGLLVTEQLVRKGFKKYNIAGGEPFSLPYLADKIKLAKEINPDITTSVITNGSLVLKRGVNALKQFEVDGENKLDIFAMSIDSLNPDTQDVIGRKTGTGVMSKDDYLDVIRLVKQAEIKKLKLNIVVSEANWLEDFRPFLREVLEIMPIEYIKIIGMDKRIGQRPDELVDPFEVEQEEFAHFWNINTAGWEQNEIRFVAEPSDYTKNSYVMVNPWGSFYWQSNDKYEYGQSILDVGMDAAYDELRPYLNKGTFMHRGGNHTSYSKDAEEVRQVAFDAIIKKINSRAQSDFFAHIRWREELNAKVESVTAELYDDTEWIVDRIVDYAPVLYETAHLFAPLLDSRKVGHVKWLQTVAVEHPSSRAKEVLMRLRNVGKAFDDDLERIRMNGKDITQDSTLSALIASRIAV